MRNFCPLENLSYLVLRGVLQTSMLKDGLEASWRLGEAPLGEAPSLRLAGPGPRGGPPGQPWARTLSLSLLLPFPASLCLTGRASVFSCGCFPGSQELTFFWGGCDQGAVFVCVTHTHTSPGRMGPCRPRLGDTSRSWGSYQSQWPEVPLGDLVLPVGAKLWGSGVGCWADRLCFHLCETSPLGLWGSGVSGSSAHSHFLAGWPWLPSCPRSQWFPRGLWAKKKKGWNQLPQTCCSPKLQSFLLDLEPALKCLSGIGFTILSSGELYLYILLTSVISFLTQTADPINFNFVCITFCEPTF